MQYIPQGTCLAKLEAIADQTDIPINSLTGEVQEEPQSSENLKDKLKDRMNQALTIDEKINYWTYYTAIKTVSPLKNEIWEITTYCNMKS